MANIFPSTRIRRTHFSDGVEKAGVKGYTVYNHMLLPTNFGNLQDECIHLKNYVQIWDVAVERQVSVTGKDTQKLLMHNQINFVRVSRYQIILTELMLI